jgi:hypothetical protein
MARPKILIPVTPTEERALAQNRLVDLAGHLPGGPSRAHQLNQKHGHEKKIGAAPKKGPRPGKK